MREYVTMECSECKSRNYRTSRQSKPGERLKLQKYCRFCGKHTPHSERRK